MFQSPWLIWSCSHRYTAQSLTPNLAEIAWLQLGSERTVKPSEKYLWQVILLFQSKAACGFTSCKRLSASTETHLSVSSHTAASGTPPPPRARPPKHALCQCTWQHIHFCHLHFKVRHICTNAHSCHLVFLVSLIPTYWFPEHVSKTHMVCAMGSGCKCLCRCLLDHSSRSEYFSIFAFKLGLFCVSQPLGYMYVWLHKHLFTHFTVYTHPPIRVASFFPCVCVSVQAYGRRRGIEEALSVMFRAVALTGDRALSRKHGCHWKDSWHNTYSSGSDSERKNQRETWW